MGLKLSDLRATTLPVEEAMVWAEGLEEEFFRQVRVALKGEAASPQGGRLFSC